MLNRLRLRLVSAFVLLLSSCGASLLSLAPTSALAQTSAEDKAPGGRVVLVLPFDNRSGNPNLKWIGDSFPDTLDARLSSAGFLTISRDDRQFALDHLGFPLDFKPTRATTLRIAQTLDADYVIVGSYNVKDTRITVQAQVLEVNKLRLSAPLEDSAELARLFDIENAIAWKIAKQIEPQFSVALQTFLSSSAGVRLSAFENYIRGTDAKTPAERVKRLESAVLESPNYPAAQLALGKELYTDREYERAAAVLAKVPHTNRASLEAGFYLGMSRFNAAKYAEAENAFAYVASLLPLPEVVNDQGVAQTRQNKDGLALFLRASNADPNDPDYHYNLAVAYFGRGDFANAGKEVERTIKLKPTDTEATELRALIAAGRAPAAADRTNGTGFVPTTRLRRTYSEASFRQAAFQLDQMRSMRLATLPPKQQAVEYTQLGTDYLRQGLLPEAEQEFQTAMNADSSNAAAYAGMAQVRELSGNAAEARALATSALKLAPNAAAYLVLARLDLATNPAVAASEVTSALRVEPNNATALALKQTLQAKGQTVQ